MDRQRYRLSKTVFFVGFMGAGKTTLTRRLARMLGLASVDIDCYIERQCKASIKELFSRLGEDEFRRLEAEAVSHFASGEPVLVSCGGGLVCGQESRDIVREKGFVVYLYVSPDESASRISNHDTRPFFESMESVRSVNAQRVPLYEDLADCTIDTTGRPPHEVADEVVRLLLEKGIVCPIPK